ncbi:bacteriohemerythrin [Thermoflexus hugenholtzii]
MKIMWTDELSVDVPELDEQHRRLIDLLNEFYDAIERGHDEEAIRKLIEGMEEYTVFHFCTEEQFLIEINYPDLEKHQKAHQILINEVKSAKARYQNGDRRAVRELIAFALAWLYSHILKVDKKYSNYCKECPFLNIDLIAKRSLNKCLENEG